MSHKYSQFSLWLAHSSLILTTLFLPTLLPTERAVAQSSQLEQPTTDQEIQSQIEAEANRFFSRTITQFNLIILATLALLLTGAIASLWLLRKAVVREVAHLVSSNLQELNTAKSQLNKVTQDLQQMLNNAQQMNNQLDIEVEDFQQELNQKRDIISGAVSYTHLTLPTIYSV